MWGLWILRAGASPPEMPRLPDRVLVEGMSSVDLPVEVPGWPGAGMSRLWSVTSSRPDIPVEPRLLGTPTGPVVRMKPEPGAVGTTVVTLELRQLRSPGWTNRTRFAVTIRPAAFSPPSTTAATFMGEVLEAVDVDADGRLDVVGVSSLGDVVHWAFADGEGSLDPGPPQVGRGAAWTDFDGDGRLEALLVGRNQPLLVGAGPDRTVRSMRIPGEWPVLRQTGAAWLDVDDDGDEDLLLTADNLTVLRRAVLLRNEEGREFRATGLELPRTTEPPVVGDFDGDGRTDILFFRVNGIDLGEVWTRGDDGRFARSPWVVRTPGGGGVGPSVLSSGVLDFDGDRRLDLWAVVPDARWGWHELVLWRNTGTGLEVASRWRWTEMGRLRLPAWGDFDADGWRDLMIKAPVGLGFPAGSHRWAVRRNVGGRFADPGPPEAGYAGDASLGLEGAIAGDFNGDGLPDLIAGRSWSGSTLRVNRLRAVNLPPAAPDGLEAVEVPGGILLSWREAADANQSAPLTYNLRVGTTPGGNELVRSLSLDDGARLVARDGNCGFRTNRFLSLPRPPGDRVFWSVQSVDNGFAGSVWAPEQVATVGSDINKPPRVVGLSDLTVAAGADLWIPFTVEDDLTGTSRITVRGWSSDPFRFRVDDGEIGFAPEPESVGVGRRRLRLRVPSWLPAGAEVTVVAVDHHGAAVAARFRVTSVAPTGEAELGFPPAGPAGAMPPGFRLSGLAGERWRIEWSVDLDLWHPVEEITIGPGGSAMWEGPPGGEGARFFRARFQGVP